MAGSAHSAGSPCGACKFLRRKCVRGCIFAPYFCHEQGATHFAAIHKVFGASNVSKMLSQLPVNDRCRAAVTISYEAQARVQDPVYGCVSHIFSLQQQIINLQSQLASVKEQAGKSYSNGSDNSMNTSWLQYADNFNMMNQQHSNSFGNDENFMVPEVLNNIYGSFWESSNSMSSLDLMQTNSMQWSFNHD